MASDTTSGPVVEIATLTDAQLDLLAQRLAKYTTPDPDYRWKRANWSGTFSSTAIPGNAVRVLTVDFRRVGIIFANPSVNLITVAPVSNISASIGMPLSSATGPIQLVVDWFGGLVAGEWWAVNAGAAANLQIINILDLSQGG